MSANKLLQAAAGNATGEAVYVDDVFTTTLYKGSGSSQNIVNNIDLDGEGGMVWIKDREVAYWHQIADTERGANKMLSSNSSNAEASRTQHLTSFNSNGFTVGTDNDVNYSNSALAAWTFRKQAGFFDVVTYSNAGTGNTKTVSHNLGAVPAVIIIKDINDSNEGWVVYHTSLGTGKFLNLNSTSAAVNVSMVQSVSSTNFVLQSDRSGVNHGGSANSHSYVAYLFAHDDQSFGDDSDESIIKCGSYTSTGNSVTGIPIDLGFEPQWILQKNATSTSTSYWMIADTMRGLIVKDGSNYPDVQVLKPNATDTEADPSILSINSTGFTSHGGFNNGDKIIYIAIRRPMKPPETGSDALQIVSTPYNFSYPVMTVSNNNSNTRADVVLNTQRVNSSSLSQPIFMQFLKKVTESYSTTGNITTSSVGVTTSSQNSATSNAPLFYNPKQNPGWLASTVVGSTLYGFKRRPGFFDASIANIGSYTASGSHGLGVVPEMILGKRLDANGDFFVFHKDLTKNTDGKVNQNLKLNSSAAPQNASGNGYYQDISTTNYSTYWWPSTTGQAIHYLFATLPGVSKVGSYTGTGTTNNIDCGFSSSARFILIRRSNTTGDWYLWDSVRGITTGIDPFVQLNTTNAEGTPGSNIIEPYSSGFTLTSNAGSAINGSGQSFIFLAIA